MNGVSKKHLILTGLILSAMASPVWAADSVSDSDSTVSHIDTVVVTASKTKETIKAAPQAVEVITAEDMKKLGADNLVTGLQLADNLSLSGATQSGTGNQVMLRGMDSRHTLILVDGKRMSGEDTAQTANIYVLSRINLSNVERVEIVRGAASALYGSDAMGGVINIITKKNAEEGGSVGVSTGNHEMTNWYSYSTGKQGRWTATADARFTKVREINVLSSSSSSGNVYNQPSLYGTKQFYNVSTTYDFENANNNELRFDASYWTSNMQTSSSNKSSIARYNQDGYDLSMAYSGKTDRNEYEIRTYYDRLNREYRPASSALNEDGKYYNFVVEAHDTMYVNDDHTLTFGGEYRKNYYEGTRLEDEAAHEVDSVAAFVEDTWQVNDKWILQPAVRFEHNDQFGSNVSPKLGTTYNFTDHFRVKANYGLGYRAPSISDLYMNFSHTVGTFSYRILGNENLEPEKSRNFDVSLEGEKGNMFAKVTYYDNRVKNLIDYTVVGYISGFLTMKYVNIDEARIKGVESTLGYNFSDRLTFKLTHNYINGIDESDGSRLANRPRSISTAQLSYDNKETNGYNITLWDSFTDDYYFNSKYYSFNTLNVSATKRVNKDLSVFAAVEIIFDKEIDDLYMFGRVWRVGAEMKF
ncbi:MAG: TonB-dependent receptor [Veillonella sp.]|uniref:TonB-dependent receptor plug domain-containing protein n=1 Tax=Veillonella sp. TaxID=1926307 RepID=UPI0025EE55EA|nr:TonB-dependent receptor [Veillonella sp.]MBS4913623.1 TonB-dependent receptor [Veillonella sp.]